MKKIALLAAACLTVAVPALAQTSAGGAAPTTAATAVQSSGGDISATIRKASGESTSRTVAAGLADVYNLADHGALGDATSDTAALNKALTYAGAHPGTHIFLPNGTWAFVVSSSGGFALPSYTTFEGADEFSTILTWNDTNSDSLFTSTGTPTTRAVDVTWQNFAVQGTWGTAVAAQSGVTSASTAYALGNTAIIPANNDGITIEHVASINSRGFGIGTRDSTSVRIKFNFIYQSLSDGINTDGCSDIDISENHLVHIGDDMISSHGYLSDRWGVRRDIRIQDNTGFDTRAIDVISPRHAIISGNRMDHWRQAMISLSNAPSGTSGQEGNEAGDTALITGNVGTNGLDNSAVDGSNSPSGATAIVISGFSSRAGTLNATPGLPDATNGVVVPVRPYFLSNSQSANTPVPPTAHIVVSNNMVMRTEPQTDGTVTGFTNYQNLWQGSSSGALGNEATIMSILGPQTPGMSSAYNTKGLTDVNLRPNFVTLAGTLNDIWIVGNHGVGLAQGFNIEGGSGQAISRLHILGNNLSDFTQQAVIVSSTGHVDGEIGFNNIDGDPLLQNGYRGTHGTWSTGAGPVAFQIQSGASHNIDYHDNTLKNLALDTYNITFPATPTEGDRWSNNKEYADWSVVGSYSSANKGIGLVHGGSGFELIQQDSDPSDGAALGNILSTQITQAPAMPTTGKWQVAWIVWNSAPSTSAPVGWQRLTSGSGNVLGIDWQSVYGGGGGTNPQTASYTVTASDCPGGTIIENSTSATTVTIPSTMAIKCRVEVTQLGTGTVTVAAGSNETLGSFNLSTNAASTGSVPVVGQYGSLVIEQKSTGLATVSQGQ